jgi:excinuclease ABC subunit A
MSGLDHISLRGVEVHNLQSVDLDIPHRKLVVLCGVSGSGKSSLALDTLYAEGQRRYIESFSAYTRQFLQRLEKPEAERIDGIPPAIAVTGKNTSRSSRSTVGTATEVNDYLRLLYAKIGQVICQGCGREVRRETPQSAAELLAALPEGTRYMIAFGWPPAAGDDPAQAAAAMKEDGFVRVVAGGRTLDLTTDPLPATPPTSAPVNGAASNGAWYVVVDRLTAGTSASDRVRDSLETAFAKGRGHCYAFIADGQTKPLGNLYSIDDCPWRRLGFSNQLACADCGRDYPEPEPRLYSFNSPLGACPECEGFGNVIDVDMDLVVPNPQKSIREGAIAPWNSPAYAHELKELLALAGDYQLRVDVPFSQLTAQERDLIIHGVAERKFGGLDGFFAWLERRKYKMHIRVFLSRWRSYRPCPACAGARLRPQSLATQIGGRNIAELSAMRVAELARWFQQLVLTDWQRQVARIMLDQICARLGYLEAVGLGYLSLDRTLRTLSGGEARRVALTSALGSALVNMLYVLDEPSVGLHARDVSQLIEAIGRLRDRGNTVVLVEHEESMIRAADEVIEIGPGAGERGGRVVFQGTPAEMEASSESLTGDYLAGRRGIAAGERRRKPEHGWIRVAGARGNNLRNLTVEFPLGVLCLVTGVSGSGKSTLVQDTLYPALCRRLRQEAPKPYEFDDVFGDGQIDEVVMVDQSPIGRSPRSNPVTYLKVFDETYSPKPSKHGRGTSPPAISASTSTEDAVACARARATCKSTCSSSPMCT